MTDSRRRNREERKTLVPPTVEREKSLVRKCDMRSRARRVEGFRKKSIEEKETQLSKGNSFCDQVIEGRPVLLRPFSSLFYLVPFPSFSFPSFSFPFLLLRKETAQRRRSTPG